MQSILRCGFTAMRNIVGERGEGWEDGAWLLDLVFFSFKKSVIKLEHIPGVPILK